VKRGVVLLPLYTCCVLTFVSWNLLQPLR